MKETILVLLLGSAIGIAAAYALSRYLETLIFGITIHDPLAFTLSPAVLLIAAIVAAALPAIRAAKTDPAITLRHD